MAIAIDETTPIDVNILSSVKLDVDLCDFTSTTPVNVQLVGVTGGVLDVDICDFSSATPLNVALVSPTEIDVDITSSIKLDVDIWELVFRFECPN